MTKQEFETIMPDNITQTESKEKGYLEMSKGCIDGKDCLVVNRSSNSDQVFIEFPNGYSRYFDFKEVSL